MLRSTSKQVKDKIQGWLIELAKEGLQGYLPQKDYDGQVTEQEIENTPMTAVNRMFEIEKAWQIKQEGRQNAFNDWQRGLCSCLPAYIHHHVFALSGSEDTSVHCRSLEVRHYAKPVRSRATGANRQSRQKTDWNLYGLLKRKMKSVV